MPAEEAECYQREEDSQHEGCDDENINSKGRAKSDTGVTAERWLLQGANRYSKQAKSDSGIIMTEKIPAETMEKTSTATMSKTSRNSSRP